MTAQDIKNFAEQSAQVLDTCRSMLHKVASERDLLKAQLETAGHAVSFDAEAMRKAASTIHELHGSPSNISVEQIVECWQRDPNSVVKTLNKIASSQINTIATGNHLGNKIEKTASASEEELSADVQLFNKYN